MKILLAPLGFVISFFASYSQNKQMPLPGPGRISGKVVDAVSKQPVEYSSITLKSGAASKPVNGTISDKNGAFVLNNLPAGNYSVEIEFIGYTAFLRDSLLITGNTTEIKLGDILLVKKSTTLEAVTVTGTRQLIETKIDKLVYNVEKDVTSQGGIATDALKKIPGITVDVDGNVELLGNSSIRFLIDGKPSGIFGNSVAEALQSIPASQVQSIEVITSPGAKYDAAGTGGIINIILKKSRIQGFNGNVNVTTGTRLENGSVNIGWRKNSFGINAYFSGNAQLNAHTPNGMDRITSDKAATGYNRLLQDNNYDFGRNSYKTGIGFDWDISQTENLAATFGYDYFFNRNRGNTNQSLFTYDNAGNELSGVNSFRNADTKFNVRTFDNSLVYKKKFKRKQQELDISYTGSFGRNNTFYNQLQYYNTPDNPFAGSNSLNPGIENEVDFAIDYVQPMAGALAMETGLKSTFQSIISNADVFSFNAAAGKFVKDETQSYASEYRRQVYAGYLSFNFPLFHFLDIKAGGRIEHTISTAGYSNSPKSAIPDYNNFAPSVIISHSFSNQESIKFAYSYRIERPDYRDLNPFMNLSDPHNITTGNPNLQPEIGNNFELAYSKSFDNGASLNLLLFYQRNSPDIKPYITYYPTYKIGDSTFNDVTITTRANISSEVKAGISIASMLPLGNAISIRTNLQVFNRHMKNIYAVPVIINALGLRTNMNATWQIGKQLIAEAFGNYNLGMHWQGKQASLFSYTFAVRQQIWKNKASVGLVAVNPFNKYIHQNSLQETPDFTTHIYRDIPYRSFGISFLFKFGKLKFTRPKDSDNYLYAPPTEN